MLLLRALNGAAILAHLGKNELYNCTKYIGLLLRGSIFVS